MIKAASVADKADCCKSKNWVNSASVRAASVVNRLAQTKPPVDTDLKHAQVCLYYLRKKFHKIPFSPPREQDDTNTKTFSRKNGRSAFRVQYGTQVGRTEEFPRTRENAKIQGLLVSGWFRLSGANNIETTLGSVWHTLVVRDRRYDVIVYINWERGVCQDAV